MPEAVARFAENHGTEVGRAMLIARYCGASNAEIASSHGVHVDTVKRRLREEFLRPLQADGVLDLDRAARIWFAVADRDLT